MINLNHLRIFYHAAKHLSFTKAAEDLFITQPAVTNQLRMFEDNLGMKLFIRISRNICLTEQGKMLYEYARKLFELESEIENAIDDIKKLRVGVLSVGAVRTYARTLMPVLIAYFHKFHPAITFRIDEGSSQDIIESLFTFKNEVAIVARVSDRQGIVYIPLCREELVVILPPNHRLKEKKSISVEDLHDEQVIMREKGSGTRRSVDALFEKHRITPHIMVEATNTELIKEMVQRKEGISFMSRHAASAEIREGDLNAVLIDGPTMYLDIYIAHLKAHRLSGPALAFLDIMDKVTLGDRPVEGIRTLMKKMVR